jgi:hypothetical protein
MRRGWRPVGLNRLKYIMRLRLIMACRAKVRVRSEPPWYVRPAVPGLRLVRLPKAEGHGVISGSNRRKPFHRD